MSDLYALKKTLLALMYWLELVTLNTSVKNRHPCPIQSRGQALSLLPLRIMLSEGFW